MKTTFLLLTFWAMSSCISSYTPEQLYGYYAAVGYVNTFDTIQLKTNSLYHRKIYDKHHRLVLEMKGKWLVERDEVIRFPSTFFLNLDQDIIKASPESLADTSMDWQGGIETRGGVIGFCVGYNQGENCYKKISD